MMEPQWFSAERRTTTRSRNSSPADRSTSTFTARVGGIQQSRAARSGERVNCPMTPALKLIKRQMRPEYNPMNTRQCANLLRRGARMRLLASIHRSAWKWYSAKFAQYLWHVLWLPAKLGRVHRTGLCRILRITPPAPAASGLNRIVYTQFRQTTSERHGVRSLTARAADRFARTAQPQRWPYSTLARHSDHPPAMYV
jgi:hypothetical protein